MKIKDFFENLHVFFQDEEDAQFMPITATIERDENGVITEIRFVNETYDEFLVVDKKGNVLCINVAEEEGDLEAKSQPKKK